jgi:DNA polymerase-3 subunit delta'
LKTLEEPPANSLLLLLSAMPEALPDTIISRCIPIQLAATKNGAAQHSREIVDLLRQLDDASWSVQQAYRLAQQLQRLLATVRDEVRSGNDEALKQEEARYRNATDSSWLDEREDYYKALSESQYLERRGRVIEALFAWWTDVLRTKTGVAQRDFPELGKQVEKVAARFSPPEILRRIRRLEQMRDHLGRNIQEALAIETAFLSVFGS